MTTNRNIINKFREGCTLAVPASPCHQTFALRQLENRNLLYKSHDGHPRFYRLRALGSLQNPLPSQLNFGKYPSKSAVNNNT